VSVRDLFLLVFVFACLPYALLRPFFGLVLFSWLAYMRPQDLTWGVARSTRFSLFVGLAMIAGWFFYEHRPFTRRFPQRKWLLALLGLITLSLFVNPMYNQDEQVKKWMDLVKVFLVCLLTVGLVDNRRRLDFLLWTIALSLGFYGVKCGLFGLLTGGRILQGPGGMLQDNNDLALAMSMNLPLLWYLGHTSASRNVRLGMTAAFFLSILTVVLTTSRGGFLTMSLVLGLMVLRSRHRMVGISAGFLAVLLFVIFLPKDVRERLATLKDPTAEGSAQGRLYAWRVAWEMGRQNPLLGVGFYNFTSVFRRYDPHPRQEWEYGKGEGSVRVAHNSYMQVLAESGFPALFCFMILVPSTLLLLQKTRRLGRSRDGPAWVIPYVNALQISLIAFAFGAIFLNRSHFDLFYHLITIAAALHLIARKPAEVTAGAPGRAPKARALPRDPYLLREPS